MNVHSRRRFLRNAGLILGTGAALNVVGCGAAAAPVFRAEIRGSRLHFDTAIPELALPGDGVALVSGATEYPVLLIRREDGTFAAVSAECTHLGCTVKKQRSLLRCPCHGSAYDFEGNVLNGPADVPLHRFTVIQEGTIVEIRL